METRLRLLFVFCLALTGGCGVMANPVLETLSESAADALQGTTDAVHGTSLPYIGHGVGPDDTPKIRTKLTQREDQVASLIGPSNQGLVIDKGGLNIGVFKIVYEIAGVKKTYAGQTSLAMTDNATNYVYLDGSSSTDAQVSTSAFPDDVFMLAEVITSSGDITSPPVDQRMRNFETGLTNAWASIAASQDVDMNGKGLDDLLHAEFTAPTTLTISSGAITPTQTWHKVEGESGAPDLLDSITAVAGEIGRLLLLEQATTNEITIGDQTSTGENVFLAGSAGAMSLETVGGTNEFILFIQDTATTWKEIARGSRALSILEGDLDVAGHSFLQIGTFHFSKLDRVIAAGTFTQTRSLHAVDTESAALTDDLDTVTRVGGGGQELLVMYPANTLHTVVVKHAVGADKFLLANGLDFAMDSAQSVLVCFHNGTQWQEISRAPYEPRDMLIASDPERDSIPYHPGGHIHLAGVFLAGDDVREILCDHTFTIKSAGAVVTVAPSGGPVVVDVQINTGGGFASIFPNDAARIFIADGTKSDTSTEFGGSPGDPWPTVTAGDILRISVLTTDGSPNAAQNLTVVINGRTPMVDSDPGA